MFGRVPPFKNPVPRAHLEKAAARGEGRRVLMCYMYS